MSDHDFAAAVAALKAAAAVATENEQLSVELDKARAGLVAVRDAAAQAAADAADALTQVEADFASRIAVAEDARIQALNDAEKVAQTYAAKEAEFLARAELSNEQTRTAVRAEAQDEINGLKAVVANLRHRNEELAVLADQHRAAASTAEGKLVGALEAHEALKQAVSTIPRV